MAALCGLGCETCLTHSDVSQRGVSPHRGEGEGVSASHAVGAAASHSLSKSLMLILFQSFVFFAFPVEEAAVAVDSTFDSSACTMTSINKHTTTKRHAKLRIFDNKSKS